VPNSVSLTPDGQSLLMFSFSLPNAALLAAPIGQENTRPAIILLDDRGGEEELLTLGRLVLPTVSADGKVLMLGNLIRLERAE
jgi:hypothetical protein